MLDPTRHKQLFLDDHALDHTSGVTRTLHQPTGHEPVVRPDRAHGQISVQSRSAPQWNSEKSLWEWWYWMYYRVPPHGQYHSTEARINGYVTSPDGIHWDAPSLGRYEWAGSRNNNIALSPDARTLYHIVRDERTDDDQQRYKALFDVHDRYLGVSPNGFDWTLLDTPPIPSQDESHFLYDDSSQQFLAYVKQPTEWGRSVWLATSPDFQSFSELQLVFHTDEIDRRNRKLRVQQAVNDPDYLSPPLVDPDADYNAECYQMAVMPYEGQYVGFPVLFNPAGAIPPPHRNYTALNQVELTVSRDRVHWDRVADRALFLPVDTLTSGRYGTTQKLLCGTPHVYDNREIRIYYNALRHRGHWELYEGMIDPGDFEDGGALVLAKLRLDGFVSLDAAEAGQIVTKPIAPAGGRLMVNVDARDGQIQAELLDAATQEPLAGYTLADANAVHGDHLQGHLTWENQAHIPQDRAVQIRFHLQRAQLYAFWVATQ